MELRRQQSGLCSRRGRELAGQGNPIGPWTQKYYGLFPAHTAAATRGKSFVRWVRYRFRIAGLQRVEAGVKNAKQFRLLDITMSEAAGMSASSR